MFEILSNFITGILSKIFEKGIDIKSQPLESKHKVFTNIFELYKSLYDLEITSRAALEKFRVMEKEVVVRTQLSHVLEQLFNASEKFIKKLEELRYALSVYIPSIYVDCVGVASEKLRFLYKAQSNISAYDVSHMMSQEKINTVAELIPRPIAVANGGLTASVSYPVEFPDIKQAELFEKELNFDQTTQVAFLWPGQKEEVSNLKKKFLNSVKKKTINFDNKSEIRDAMQLGEVNIRQIEVMRKELALFIKEKFPINDILM